MTKETRDTVINLRTSTKLKNDLQKLADLERRSLSDYLNLELEKLVEKSKKK